MKRWYACIYYTMSFFSRRRLLMLRALKRCCCCCCCSQGLSLQESKTLCVCIYMHMACADFSTRYMRKNERRRVFAVSSWKKKMTCELCDLQRHFVSRAGSNDDSDFALPSGLWNRYRCCCAKCIIFFFIKRACKFYNGWDAFIGRPFNTWSRLK